MINKVCKFNMLFVLIMIFVTNAFAFDPRTALMEASFGGIKLVLPAKELGPDFNLTEYFKGHSVNFRGPVNENDATSVKRWESSLDRAKNALIKRSKEGRSEDETRPEIEGKDLPQFLALAKQTLASFLASDDKILQEVLSNDSKYIKKSNIGRLFTYAKLGDEIRSRGLLRIKLPRKILIIKDKNGRPLSRDESLDVLNKNIILRADYFPTALRVEFNLDGNYKYEIYAQKIEDHAGLNQMAGKELIQLVKSIPFDVGFGNIFTDEHGNAVIIDTEFKNDPWPEAVWKLGRYGISVPENLLKESTYAPCPYCGY